MFNGIFNKLSEEELEAVCTAEGRTEILCADFDFSIDIIARHIVFLMDVAQIPLQKLACRSKNREQLLQIIQKYSNNNSIAERIKNNWILEDLVNVSYFIVDGQDFKEPIQFLSLKNATLIVNNTYYILSDSALFYQNKCHITISNVNKKFVLRPSASLKREVERTQETFQERVNARNQLASIVQSILEEKTTIAQTISRIVVGLHESKKTKDVKPQKKRPRIKSIEKVNVSDYLDSQKKKKLGYRLQQDVGFIDSISAASFVLGNSVIDRDV